MAFPHEYNVLDHFHVVEIWAEKNNGKTCFRFRLEKLDLLKQGWWVAKGTPARTELPDFSFACPSKTCKACGEASKVIFNEAWACLIPTCPRFFKDMSGTDLGNKLTYSAAFLKERTYVPPEMKPSHDMQPPLFTMEGESPEMVYSDKGWRGMCCPQCGCCSKRRSWTEWRCENCDFVHRVPKAALSPNAVRAHRDYEPSSGHHAAPADDRYSVTKLFVPPTCFGGWKIFTYELTTGNYVTHFLSNWDTNHVENGANDMFRELQLSDDVGLMRGNNGKQQGMSPEVCDLRMLADCCI